MRDYSKYEKTPVLFSGAEKKFESSLTGFVILLSFRRIPKWA